jgi:hypothetical protein
LRAGKKRFSPTRVLWRRVGRRAATARLPPHRSRRRSGWRGGLGAARPAGRGGEEPALRGHRPARPTRRGRCGRARCPLCGRRPPPRPALFRGHAGPGHEGQALAHADDDALEQGGRCAAGGEGGAARVGRERAGRAVKGGPGRAAQAGLPTARPALKDGGRGARGARCDGGGQVRVPGAVGGQGGPVGGRRRGGGPWGGGRQEAGRGSRGGRGASGAAKDWRGLFFLCEAKRRGLEALEPTATAPGRCLKFSPPVEQE